MTVYRSLKSLPFALLSGAVLVIGDVLPAVSAGYPAKPVQITIPWGAGGRSDIVSRMLGACMEKELGVSVSVNNMTGGGGLVGSLAIRDAKPDGYTLSVGGLGLAIIQYGKKTDIRLSDFTWVSRVYSSPLVVAVPGTSPFKTFAELVSFAKANPGKLQHGSTSAGGSTHIASEILARDVGMKITQLPYRGEGKMVVGVASGEADFAVGLMPSFRPFLEDRRLRIIGVADQKRDDLFPEVPTLKEQGFDVTLTAFEALFLPKGAPQEVVDRLNQVSKECLSEDQLRERFAKIGLNVAYQPGPDFVKWMTGFDRDLKSIMDSLGLTQKK